MLKYLKGYKVKSKFDYKYIYGGAFIAIAGFMLLVCYEWMCVDHNITSWLPSKFVPIVYSISTVITVGYYEFKGRFEKKDGNK